MSNRAATVRTVVGFLKSVLVRRLPFLNKGQTLASIFNYHDVAGLFPTSGQPNERQFELIKQAGYDTVINLAPASRLENAVIEEAQILQSLGIRYVHLPVDFENPTDEDFAKFVEAVKDRENLWVHCAANMRVSAFTYRYRCEVLQHDPASARADLDRIWEPYGVWRKFLGWDS